jgi:hypothetical protein
MSVSRRMFIAIPLAAGLFLALCETVVHKATLGHLGLVFAMGIIAIWLAVFYWLFSANRGNTVVSDESNSAGSWAPNPGIQRNFATLLGFVVLTLLSASAIFAFLIGAKGIAAIVSGKYAAHLYFACFFYTALLLGACG